jgi:hypothetical protein
MMSPNRSGKIARLPRPLGEELNRRLDRGGQNESAFAIALTLALTSAPMHTRLTLFMVLVALSLVPARLRAAEPDLELGFDAEPLGEAMLFRATPGTNTLMNVLDQVRLWRSGGHLEQAAIIRLPPGEYTLTEPIKLDARDHKITLIASVAAKTLISGGQRIGGWVADTNGVWHAKTALRFEQFYVNGQRATRARFPATGYFQMDSVQSEDQPANRARLTVKVSATNREFMTASPETLREAQVLAFHNWDTSRYRLATVDPAAGTFSVLGERMQPWNPWNAHTRFILDNCTGGAPLAPGTWILDNQGELSYCPRKGEKMATADGVVPMIDRFVQIDGANNIQFDNLRFEYARYDLPPAGCPPGQAAAAIPAVIEVEHSTRIMFRSCEVAHTGTYGLWFQQGCQNCLVRHSLLHDLGAGGIRIGEMGIPGQVEDQTSHIVINDNIIRHWGRVHPSAVGVWIGQSANNRITHNEISDSFYTGISVGWTWGYGFSQATNNLIGFNRIHQIGQGVLSDMGAIYTLGVSPGSASVGNLIYDVRAHDYGGWGIYPDEGSTGWRIESNVVWHCTCLDPHGGGAFHQHYGATNLIANNIFALSSGPTMQATRVEDHLSFILERNIIVSTNNEFFTGPWDKIQFQSRSNCFVLYGTPKPQPFPGGDLAQWQQAGRDQGSILTNGDFIGTWPNVQLPAHSKLYSVGFRSFTTKLVGPYGDAPWHRAANQTDPEVCPPISPE